MSIENLSNGLGEALAVLRASHHPDARVDALDANWAYVWLPHVQLPPEKFPPPHERGLWARIPVQFPHVVPHGIVTLEALLPLDGHGVNGHNAGHDMCNPVRAMGGAHYYSWTWSGDLGQGPRLTQPSDILRVVAWIERRIRNA